MPNITIGVRALTKTKYEQKITEGRFFVEIPLGTDVFVYTNGVQRQSEAVKKAWHEQHGQTHELQSFVLG